MKDRELWRSTPRDARAHVEEELGYHLEARMRELMWKGMTEEAARAEALRRLGNMNEVLADCVASDVRRTRRVERRELFLDVVQDARHGLRQLMRRPLLAIASVATLGIGIGATSSIYAVADQVLIRPLPYDDPDRVVTLWETDLTKGDVLEVAPGNFVEWERSAQSFGAMGLATPYSVTLDGNGGPPIAVETWTVTNDFFTALGVRPILGRTFNAAEHEAGAAPVALMSHRMWQAEHGSDPDIIGRRVMMDNIPTEIVGVLPPSLEYPEHADIWTPKKFYDGEKDDRVSNYMFAVARLEPNATVETAQAELSLIAQRMSARYPTNRNLGATVIPLRDRVMGEMAGAASALLGAALFLLLIACANLANVLVARGMERGGELAVRSALGAGRSRIARQLVTESLLLAGLGGIAGLALAWAGIQALLALVPPELPRVSAVALDGRVLLFLLATTLITGMLFGLAPSLRLSRQQPMTTLRSGRATATREHSRMRGMLLGMQVALCVVLLVGAGLLARSMMLLLDNDLGFDAEGRASVQLFLWDNVPSPEARVARVAQLIERFDALPGVTSAAAVSSLPFHPHAITARSPVHVAGTATAAPGEAPSAFATIVSSGYFATMGIPITHGRAPTDADNAGALPVVWINEAFAREFFPAGDAIGKRIRVGAMAAPVEREIAGVVGDVRYSSLDSEPAPEFYVPHAQSGNGSMTFLAYGTGDADDLAASMRDAVYEIDRTQPVYYTATIDDLVAATLAQRRFQLTLAAVFAAMALALVALGTYAVINLWARERRHEFGVRVALGARSSDITRLVVSQALRLVVPGLLVGVATALVVTRWIGHMLYGVAPTDVLTFANVALLVLLLAAGAAWGPARSAAARPVLRSIAD
jgi:predicted permease